MLQSIPRELSRERVPTRRFGGIPVASITFQVFAAILDGGNKITRVEVNHFVPVVRIEPFVVLEEINVRELVGHRVISVDF